MHLKQPCRKQEGFDSAATGCDSGGIFGQRKRLLNVRELSDYISMPVTTIYTYVSLGKLPAAAIVRIGRALRFEKTGIDAWINDQKKAA